MGMFDQPMEAASAYDQLGTAHLFKKLKPLFDKGVLAGDAHTGKIKLGERLLYLKLPWLMSNMQEGRKCDLWLEIRKLGAEIDFAEYSINNGDVKSRFVAGVKNDIKDKKNIQAFLLSETKRIANVQMRTEDLYKKVLKQKNRAIAII